MRNTNFSQNERITKVLNSNNDPDWMAAIKTEAKIGRQLVLQSLTEHPYIKKNLKDRQVCSNVFGVLSAVFNA